MADLSSVVDFSVLLDKSADTPVIVLVDTSVYPTGVAATVTGVISVTQPDGIAVVGNFSSPDTGGDVRATATITVPSVGTGGKNIQVIVNDPIHGNVTLCTYTKQSSDTTTSILATSIAAAINGTDGYSATSIGNVVTITARSGLGASINGGTRLSSTGTTASEVLGKSFVNATRSTTGTVYTTTVNDPVSGTITINTYTQQSGDTDDTILRDSIIAAINADPDNHGYSAIPYLTIAFYIVAKPGLGASINGHRGTVAWGSSTSFGDFLDGADATTPLSVTLTQFAGGMDANLINSKELRLATDSNFQNGLYTITYTVRATGYDDTVKTKTFTLAYNAPAPNIQNLVDVFTPSFIALDTTLYTQDGFTVSSTTRNWNAEIKYDGSTIRNATGTGLSFDMVYSGAYFDAHYSISLSSVNTLVSTAYAWVSLKDKFTAASQADPYTPPTLANLLTSLSTMKSQIEAGTYCGGCGCGCGVNYEPYNTASTIYSQIVARGQAHETIGLDTYVIQLQKLFTCGILNQVHTNQRINAYDFGGLTALVSGNRRPFQFRVGDPGALLSAGGSTFTITDPNMAQGYIRVFASGDALPTTYMDIVSANYTITPGVNAVVTLDFAARTGDVIMGDYPINVAVSIPELPDLDFYAQLNGAETKNLVNADGNIYILQTNTISKVAFTLYCVSATGEIYMREWAAPVKNLAGTITFSPSTDAVLSDDFNDALIVSITGDNTAHGIKITVTGIAGKIINCHAIFTNPTHNSI